MLRKKSCDCEVVLFSACTLILLLKAFITSKTFVNIFNIFSYVCLEGLHLPLLDFFVQSYNSFEIKSICYKPTWCFDFITSWKCVKIKNFSAQFWKKYAIFFNKSCTIKKIQQVFNTISLLSLSFLNFNLNSNLN